MYAIQLECLHKSHVQPASIALAEMLAKSNVPSDRIVQQAAKRRHPASRANFVTSLSLRKNCLALQVISAQLLSRIPPALPAPPLQVHLKNLSNSMWSSITFLSGQTSQTSCLPCSPSQSCPPGTSVPTEAAPVAGLSTTQIVAYSLSAVASIIAIFVGVGRIYPAVKARIAKLREAGIKPTLMRIIFCKSALANNSNMQLISDRPNVDSKVTSVVVAQAPAALLLLTPNQIGSMVATHIQFACPFHCLISLSCRSPPSAPPLTLVTAKSSSTTNLQANTSQRRPKARWPQLWLTSAFPRNCTCHPSWML